jgi:hypothetical protein
MEKALNSRKAPAFEAVAMSGTGVFDTLKEVSKQVILELKKTA